MKKSVIIIFLSLAIFSILNNRAEAGFPTIFYTKGTVNTDGIVVETSINPNNFPTTAWVEYGISANLINFRETEHIMVGATGHPRTLFINVLNINPATVYYLRVTANNGGSTVRGDIVALQTMLPINQPQNETVNQTIIKKVPQNTNNTPINKTETKIENEIEKTKGETKNPDGSELTANVLFSQNFLPNTIPNWIAFILVTLIVSVLLIKIYLDEKNSPKLEELEK